MTMRPGTLLLSCLLAACGMPGARRESPRAAPRGGAANGAIAVLTRSDIEASSVRGTTLLQYLRSRVPSLDVRSGGEAACPQIRLRGASSMHFTSEPRVYIDGVRAGDSCVLETLSMELVNEVRVYGGGQSPEGSYGSNPGGLILVFTSRDAPPDGPDPHSRR